jgi:hypothetical protein
MDDVFLIAVPFMAVALVIALTMREKPLAGRGATPAPTTVSASDEVELVSVAH